MPTISKYFLEYTPTPNTNIMVTVFGQYYCATTNIDSQLRLILLNLYTSIHTIGLYQTNLRFDISILN